MIITRTNFRIRCKLENSKPFVSATGLSSLSMCLTAVMN